MNVHQRQEYASWYGAGFYNKKTADGTTLERDTIGVAHKALPLGPYGKGQPATYVRLTYGGNSIVVPVIDRGPFIAGRDWDLTEAAAKRLGMISKGVVPVTSEIVTSGAGAVMGPFKEESPEVVEVANKVSAASLEMGSSWGLNLKGVGRFALGLLAAWGVYKLSPEAALWLLGAVFLSSLVYNFDKLKRNFS